MAVETNVHRATDQVQRDQAAFGAKIDAYGRFVGHIESGRGPGSDDR